MDPDAPHLRPWRRGPYILTLLVVLALLVSWVVLALSGLASGAPTGALCALVVVGLLIVGSAIPLVVWRRRGLSRGNTTLGENEDALALLRAGRYGAAAELWSDLCHRARHAPNLHAIYLLNLGMAWLHEGRLRQARVLIERARASGWLTHSTVAHARAASSVGLGLLMALAGELDPARALAAELAQRLGEARRAMTMLLDAVIAARAGEELSFDAEALRRAESSLMASHVRALRLLEAFARSRAAAGTAYREGADRAPIDAIGLRPGELDFLAVEWPALRAFMDARGLLAKGAPEYLVTAAC